MIQETGKRYLCERTWQGIAHTSIEYADNERTREEVRRGKCVRTEISIPEAMMSPRNVARRRALAREVRATHD